MERARVPRHWVAFTVYGAVMFLAAAVAMLTAAKVAGIPTDELVTVLDKLLPFLNHDS